MGGGIRNAIRETTMGYSRAIALATGIAVASFANSAMAQKTLPPQTFFDDPVEVVLPGEGATASIALTGLKSAHAAWLTFIKFTDSKPVQDAQVLSLMEGVTVKWAGTRENCIYELRLVPSPPAVTVTRSSGMCALKAPGNALFRVFAM
jgi:hypothetical protein